MPPSEPVRWQLLQPPTKRQTELRVVLSRRDVVVSLGLDSRGEPQQHLRGNTGFGVELIEPIELIKAVDHDSMYPRLDPHPELGT